MILQADARAIPLADESVHAIVTDPPYGLEFMGKEWDKLGGAGMSKTGLGSRPTQWVSFGGSDFGGANPTCSNCGGRARGKKQCKCEIPDWRVKGKPVSRKTDSGREMQGWHNAWAIEALRILKPGGHLLAFGGTRTYHRLVCAIEDAGFEIRDCLAWMYGSGFPKSHNIANSIDRSKGLGPRGHAICTAGTIQVSTGKRLPPGEKLPPYKARSKESEQWIGWGTALKPAFEPIILARKPLSESTVAANVQRWGTGGLNIDACRIKYEDGGTLASNPSLRKSVKGGNGGRIIATETESREMVPHSSGRFPANVVLDEEAGAMLDEQSGKLTSGTMRAGTRRTAQDEPGSVCYGTYGGNATYRDTPADTGGASRFFYCAKASKEDRAGGDHPTVKPVELMKWLIRLVSAKGQVVLDPFCGSGTTVQAGISLGRETIGMDLSWEYLSGIAKGREAQTEMFA